MCATLAGTPSLSARRKSISRYARLCPPPWCRVVLRPWTFRPPWPCSGRTRDFSGSLRVISEKSAPLAPRLPGVVGLYLRIPICAQAPLDVAGCLADRAAEDIDPLPLSEADDGALGGDARAVAVPGPPPLPRPVKRVDAGYLDPEHGLDRLPDLGPVGVGGDQEGVLAVVGKPVRLLRDHRAQQDVPGVRDPVRAHCSSPSFGVVRRRGALG